MYRYVARRIAYAVVVVWAAFTISFALLYALPSDPVSLMLLGPASGDAASAADSEQRAALEARYGLDQPVLVQYGQLLLNALRGDLGVSVQADRPVADLIAEALPETLKISALALVLAIVTGLLVAVVANLAQARWLRNVLFALPPLGSAFPTFWIGLMLLQVLSFRLGLFPAIGNEGPQSVVLPAITLAVPASATFAQVLARGLERTLREPFVDVVVVKGASRSRVHLGHGLRNAVVPALTLVGLSVGGLLAGSVVTETVFSRNGIGRLLQTAVNTQDIPVVQALVLVSAVVFALVNLAVDLITPVVDPRVRRAHA
ncbi:ABC transporter permease [Promicromonospora sp. NPDC057488]|uniref:ABC transporter permease n=1 Tax=Promicromonospora sp. NPDC057488 TaxID=3346147 RepID=UPI003672860A